MQQRSNKLFERVINKGIATAKFKDKKSAIEMMMRAGVPQNIIERVLSDPQKLRSTDWK